MSRLSFRPRPVDIHKRLPILKSLKDFEDDENPSSTRNSQTFRYDVEPVNEVPQTPTKKLISEIPTPQYVDVDTYDRDYSRTFTQPTSYIHARGARAELGDFVEYDLDNEDEDWLEDFNRERTILTAEKFETILFKLEVLDHKVRERAGVITPPTLGSPIPVVLSFDAAIEALQSFSVMYGVFQSIYSYWKRKRQQTQKPVLRRLQPPPPVSDTNPFNVFRPREKAHRLHTRRMQRRENNIQSFEKLRLVRRNLEQSKTMLGALIKREEKKRELIESEVNLQRSHIIYKNESELLLEDSLGTPGMRSFYNKVVVSSDDEYVDSDDVANSRGSHQPLTESKVVVTPRREIRWRQAPRGWVHKLDPNEPVLMFTKPVDEEKLGNVGIKSPLNGPIKLHGRMGRGGRIIFDRWNPLMHTPIDYVQP